jgi:hypothetical protein
MTIVNGPVRKELEMNDSYSLFGPGNRANASIGRAISLININCGGRIPGKVSKSTLAQPGRYTFCFAEREEENPWEPLHVERGYAASDSVATVACAFGTVNMQDFNSRTGDGLLTTFTHSMTILGSNNMFPGFGLGEMVVVLCPDHARLIARDGMSKRDVQQYFFKHTSKIPLDWWPKEKHHWLIDSGRVVEGGYTPLANRPEQFMIVVAGGGGGIHSAFIPTRGESWAVSTKV